MKKFSTVFVVLLALTLVACGGKQNSTPPPPPPPPPPSSATLVGGWAGTATLLARNGIALPNPQVLGGGQLNIGEAGGVLAGNFGGLSFPCANVGGNVTATQSHGSFTVTGDGGLALNGSITGSGTGTTIAGDIYFDDPCGSGDRYRGTFSMNRTY